MTGGPHVLTEQEGRSNIGEQSAGLRFVVREQLVSASRAKVTRLKTVEVMQLQKRLLYRTILTITPQRGKNTGKSMLSV